MLRRKMKPGRKTESAGCGVGVGFRQGGRGRPHWGEPLNTNPEAVPGGAAQVPGKSRWAEEAAGAQAQTGVSQSAEVSGLEPEHEGGSGGRTAVTHLNIQV